MSIDLLAFAHQLADLSGAAIRPYFGQKLTVEAKADHSPVSIADREAEAVIRIAIEKAYPDHGIYGEEHGISGADKKYVWVIDPIDGTRAFLAGKKEWGTLIALCEEGVPILGVLNQPVLGERWVGIRGGQTTYNGTACSTISGVTISDAEISSTYCAPPDDARFDMLANQCAKRIEAGDCYAYGLLANGLRNIVCDTSLKPYDILALVPIIEAAGGIITGWDGAPVTLSHHVSALACGDKSLHSAALALLQGA